MNTRLAPPEIDPEVFGEPITDADWAAMCPEERTFLQEGIDALDRGEFITHDEMKLEFQRMRDRLAAR